VTFASTARKTAEEVNETCSPNIYTAMNTTERFHPARRRTHERSRDLGMVWADTIRLGVVMSAAAATAAATLAHRVGERTLIIAVIVVTSVCAWVLSLRQSQHPQPARARVVHRRLVLRQSRWP
jgi:hypothetical protein